MADTPQMPQLSGEALIRLHQDLGRLQHAVYERDAKIAQQTATIAEMREALRQLHEQYGPKDAAAETPAEPDTPEDGG